MADDKKQQEDTKVYVSADGRVHSTPEKAIEGSLTFELTSGTGAGCNQSPDQVSSPPALKNS